MRTEVKYGVSDQIPLARQVACSLLRLLRDPRDRTLGPLKSITAGTVRWQIGISPRTIRRGPQEECRKPRHHHAYNS